MIKPRWISPGRGGGATWISFITVMLGLRGVAGEVGGLDLSAYFNLISLSSFCVSQTAAAVEEQRPIFGHGHVFLFFFKEESLRLS